jgi:hypothetical protein
MTSIYIEAVFGFVRRMVMGYWWPAKNKYIHVPYIWMQGNCERALRAAGWPYV